MSNYKSMRKRMYFIKTMILLLYGVVIISSLKVKEQKYFQPFLNFYIILIVTAKTRNKR